MAPSPGSTIKIEKVTPPTYSPMSVFPPIADVIDVTKKEKPGKGFCLLMEDLMDAGLSTSADILVLEESALTAIGNMGWPHAWALRNFAKRLALPVLGMNGSYQEPELGELPNLRLAHIKTEKGAVSSVIKKEALKKEDSIISIYESFEVTRKDSPDVIEVNNSGESDSESEDEVEG